MTSTPRPAAAADEVPYWGVNDSFEEEGDDADADLDAEGRKKLTVRQQCLRLFSLVIFVVLFLFVVIARRRPRRLRGPRKPAAAPRRAMMVL